MSGFSKHLNQSLQIAESDLFNFRPISGNSIGDYDDGVKALADMLKRNTSLTSIGLSSKSEFASNLAVITVFCFPFLFQKQTCVLGNKIRGDSAKTLVTALIGNTSLKSIDLSGESMASLFRSLQSYFFVCLQGMKTVTTEPKRGPNCSRKTPQLSTST